MMFEEVDKHVNNNNLLLNNTNYNANHSTHNEPGKLDEISKNNTLIFIQYFRLLIKIKMNKVILVPRFMKSATIQIESE